MSTFPVVSIVHLVTANPQAREIVQNLIHDIIEYSREREPGVVKYAVCLPDNDPPSTTKDDTSVYIIEEYTTKEVFDQHMNSTPVKTLLGTATEQKLLLPTTKIYNVAWLSDAILSRPERLPSQVLASEGDKTGKRVQKPYVLFATITDPDAKDIETLEPYGAAIVEYARDNEPDTIFYADARPIDMQTGKEIDANAGDTGGFICAVEVYASKEACGAHLKDESVKNLTVEGYKLGSRFQLAPMIVQEGWLIRE